MAIRYSTWRSVRTALTPSSMPGQRTEGRTPIRIETTFHELHGSFQIFAPSSDLGFLSVCIRERERDRRT